MIVSLIENERISSTTLPEKIKGQYWLYSFDGICPRKVISIEGINSRWVMKSGRDIDILDDTGAAIKSIDLTDRKVYKIQQSDGRKMVVFTEPVSEDRQIFSKYLVYGQSNIVIGRNENCDIVINNNLVSSIHATLSIKNGKWTVEDANSTNGVFVNGRKVSSTELAYGDMIYIMGFKCVVGKQFIAINNPDDAVKINNPSLISYITQQEIDENEEYEIGEQDYFYRSPRFKRDIKTAKFKIDPPPQSPVADEMPLVLVLGSAMAMGMMSLVTLITAFMSNNYVSMVMGGSMLIGTVLLPIITKGYEKRRNAKREQKRQKKYREYLDSVQVTINEEIQNQSEIINENIVTIEECESRIMNTSRILWERGIRQNDFLRIRAGVGDEKLDAEFSYSERKFSIDDDNLQEELYNICEKPRFLENVPIAFSLYENYISAIIGKRKQTVEFAKGIIMQIAALYSYDEVKMVFLYDNKEKDEFEFTKWLPHVWNNDKTIRLIATTGDEVKEVSAYLEREFELRNELNETEIEDILPYYVIFAMDQSLSNRAEVIRQVLSQKDNKHFSVVTLYDELRNVPKESSMVIELLSDQGRLFDINDISGKSIAFSPDIYLTKDSRMLSVMLANTKLNNTENGYSLPNMLTFMNMYEVGKIEHLNISSRWKESDPSKSLAAAVGVNTYGETFMLDLHEKFQGPHGLIAGMTGSGKSEFIMTYILSLAVNYHPNEVGFVLIDYKGGGMAKSFENLPHTVGIITNLDGASIKRSLISIESELKRRQKIFSDAGKLIGESNVDIYKYQKLFREGVVDEPLQHLFIISDEFAELKTQQPEFMTQLVSAARIGRSLGIHLILATQKPSGVVDDQIWSNSKFRVCLKVQERADSMDMLKRPDAAELKQTGRFYLQVGYNELFELGQSAWAGAPYHPSDKPVTEKDESIVVIDKNGHTRKQVKLKKESDYQMHEKKQLDAITEHLRTLADEEELKVKSLWLDPIPSTIMLDDIIEKYAIKSERFVLDPVIGEYDDPVRQRQCALRLPITKEGNAVVYGAAGSGKTMFLNAMIYSMIREHTPDEVNLYMLDFASETLTAFRNAPQVGDVILSNEAEKVHNLIRMLNRELENRKKLFVNYGGDYQSYIKNSGGTLPSIVVAVNNFAAFTEIYEEVEEALSQLSREGSKYGIYFILTALGTGDVRFRMLQNFKQLLVLQLNDEADYATIVGKTDGLFPSKYQGRGLVKLDDIYEFQLATLRSDDLVYQFIRDNCDKMSKTWTGENAKSIPLLPDVVSPDFLRRHILSPQELTVPIGVEKNSLNVSQYSFDRSYVSIIMSYESEYQSFLNGLCSFIGSEYDITELIFDPNRMLNDETERLSIKTSIDECEEAISDLFDLVVYRNNTYKDAQDKSAQRKTFKNLLVVICSISSLRNILTDTSNEKLSLILEKGSAEYNVNVIIGESSKGVSSVTYESWYQKQVSQNTGIWVGSGIGEQYYLKPTRISSDMQEDIGDDFGYVIKNGKATKVKLLCTDKEEEADE